MSTKGFLESFFEEYKFENWIKIIDWLLKDDKFSNWSKTELTQFVTEFKKLPIIRDGLYLNGKKSVANPSQYDRNKNRTKKSIIIMVIGQGQAKDLVRHIRNGIAHGRAKLCTRNSVRCLEIIDYGKYGEKNERGGQTAYILVPVVFIQDLYNIYNRIK